jgi:hypothetical protein
VIVENDQTFDQTHIAYSVGRSFSVIGLWWSKPTWNSFIILAWHRRGSRGLPDAFPETFPAR